MLTEHEALVEHYAMALAQALYGPEFDPFTAPETYDFCVEMMGKVVPVIRTTDAARITVLESLVEQAATWLDGHDNTLGDHLRTTLRSNTDD